MRNPTTLVCYKYGVRCKRYSIGDRNNPNPNSFPILAKISVCTTWEVGPNTHMGVISFTKTSNLSTCTKIFDSIFGKLFDF